jgi:hypothetical protein
VKNPASRAWSTALLPTLAALLSALPPAPAGAQTSPADVGSIANQTFDSPYFQTMVQRMQQQSAAAVGSITDATLSRVRDELPKGEALGRLRYGHHNVVTNAGDTIVGLIIQVAHATPAQRPPLLDRLAALAAQRIPEALTFEGFAAEYGLWGTPQNETQALALYRAAAAQNYQPAVYNLAIAEAYGRGMPADASRALALISQASGIAADGSYRVCGFGAFLSYRSGDSEEALKYSRSCTSDLANIPRALYEEKLPTATRINMLRASIATGADDGYALLEEVASRDQPDPHFLACKYALLNRYRRTLNGQQLQLDATACFQRYEPEGEDARTYQIHQGIVVPGIAGFVPAEIHALNLLRSGNHFHYAWSVPYLPFRQDDVDMFEPYVLHRKS